MCLTLKKETSCVYMLYYMFEPSLSFHGVFSLTQEILEILKCLDTIITTFADVCTFSKTGITKKLKFHNRLYTCDDRET